MLWGVPGALRAAGCGDALGYNPADTPFNRNSCNMHEAARREYESHGSRRGGNQE